MNRNVFLKGEKVEKFCENLEMFTEQSKTVNETFPQEAASLACRLEILSKNRFRIIGGS